MSDNTSDADALRAENEKLKKQIHDAWRRYCCARQGLDAVKYELDYYKRAYIKELKSRKTLLAADSKKALRAAESKAGRLHIQARRWKKRALAAEIEGELRAREAAAVVVKLERECVHKYLHASEAYEAALKDGGSLDLDVLRWEMRDAREDIIDHFLSVIHDFGDRQGGGSP